MAHAYIKGSPKKVLKLEEVLKHPVDLVMADTVKPRIEPIIDRKVVYV